MWNVLDTYRWFKVRLAAVIFDLLYPCSLTATLHICQSNVGNNIPEMHRSYEGLFSASLVDVAKGGGVCVCACVCVCVCVCLVCLLSHLFVASGLLRANYMYKSVIVSGEMMRCAEAGRKGAYHERCRRLPMSPPLSSFAYHVFS